MTVDWTRKLAAHCALVAIALLSVQPSFAAEPVPVNVGNFVRAESDRYMAGFAKTDAFGKFVHRREVTAIDAQDVVRMNRDTIYSMGVFDLDASPVTITLPAAGKRYMSMQVISEDHYSIETVYAPVKRIYTRQFVGTRYVAIAVRTLVDPQNPEDVKAATALQDAIRVDQSNVGKFEVPDWDQVSLTRMRDALLVLASGGNEKMFGTKSEVDKVAHLVGTASGWGGNAPSAAIYLPTFPTQNDGTTVHTLNVKDVPVDGFWSISLYNEKGFFEKNDRNAYSINNLTAKPNPDGSYTVQFGGCETSALNCLPITTGWNYVVRLYRPRKELLSGTWKFPVAQPKR